MPTHSLITQIRARTPLHTKVAVSKTFDLAEEVSAALARTGHTPAWLAERVGISLDDLTAWLGGMHPLLDDVARLEAALETDLLVAPGRPQGYFGVTTNDLAVSVSGKVIPLPTEQPDNGKPTESLPVPGLVA